MSILLQRQCHCEGRASIELAFDADCPAMQIDCLFRNRQPQPRSRQLADILGTVESLEQARQVFRGDADSGWQPDPAETRTPPKNTAGEPDSFWEKIHSLADRFHKGLEEHEPRESTNALLELDRTIWQAQRDLESEEYISQARDTLRDLIVLTGNKLSSSPGNRTECLAPLVEALLKLRQAFRANEQWAEADAIRDTLHSVNITVEDAKNDSQWRLES